MTTIYRKLQKGIADDVRRERRSVLCIPGEEDSPSFAYTIGNWLLGLPELLIIGTTKGYLLNILSEKQIERGAAFEEGELVNLGGKFPVKIVTADQRAHREYTMQAGQYLGTEDYVVQQVLACDRNGRLPDEPGCQPPYSMLPVLSQRKQ